MSDRLYLDDIVQQCGEDSQTYFPLISAPIDGGYGIGRSIIHHSLALAGEVGEFCNIIKKVDRGSISWEEARSDAAEELTDVLIYVANLAAIMDISLEAIYQIKRQFNNERFTNASSPDSSNLNARVHDKQQSPLGPTSIVGVDEVLDVLPATEV